MTEPSEWKRLYCSGCLRYVPSNADNTVFWHAAPGLGAVIGGNGCPGSRKPGFYKYADAVKNRLSQNPYDYQVPK